jgi:ATP-dependent Clp protease adaptor protein ClpS
MAPATQTPTRERARTGGGGGTGDAWKVIVLNDNHNTFDGVAFGLAKTIPGVSFDRGLELADKIHRSGKAIVWSGHREQAEHYWEQLKGFG